MKPIKTLVLYTRHGVHGFADEEHLTKAIKEDESLPIIEKRKTFMFTRPESLSEALELCSQDEQRLLKLFNMGLELVQMKIAKEILESGYRPDVVDLAEPLTTVLKED